MTANDAKELLRRVLAMLKACTVESGVCHCGAAMDDHNGYDGHSAIDEGSSVADQLQADISEFLDEDNNDGE